MFLNAAIAILQTVFILMNYTVEREYCRAPLDPDSTILFVKDAYDFGVAYNPYFHERPEWLVKATCIHAYVFWILYSLIFYLAVTDGWARSRLLSQLVVPLFLGAKVYAILFYHFMEFTSDSPPTKLVPYFLSEGGYLVSIALVFYKLLSVAFNKAKHAKED